MNDKVIIEFAKWITGHDEQTIIQMYDDWASSPARQAIQMQAQVKVQKCEQKFEDFRDIILAKEKEGKIIISTFDGLVEGNLDDIIDQPTEGLLYDLNRNRETILTYIYDQKWINDFACMKVIEKLKALLSA